ncbi:MAG: DUF1189 domain-containing protein [Candidatus Saccharibacteria bacterium]
MGFFSRLINSILKPAAYNELVQMGLGKAMGYLILLVLLITVPVHGYQAYEMSGEFKQLAVDLAPQIPNFTLANGELQVDAKMPLILDQTEQNIIVIDTTGTTDQSILNDYPGGFLLTKTKMYVKQTGGQITETDYTQFKDMSFNKESLLKLIPLLNVFGFLLVLLGWIWVYLCKLLQVFTIMGLITLIVSAVTSAKLKYEQSVTVATYAMTMPFVVQGIQKVLIPTFEYPSLLYYGLFIIWIVLGVLGAKNKNTGFVEPVQPTYPMQPPPPQL